ncbi:MAG: PAS domain-containing protein [Desulfobacterales bacterium]
MDDIDISLPPLSEKSENSAHTQTEALRERIKELHCLFSISGLIDKSEASPETVFPRIAEIIRSGWQYPEDTCVRILYDRHEYRTSNYRESPCRQTADILVHNRKSGVVEVTYLKNFPCADEGPFLKEERLLINTIANRLGIHIQRKKDEKELRESRERLELALEAASDGLWDWNLATNEIYLSPRWYTMLGYEPFELSPTYETWERLLHPDDRESVVSIVRKHIGGTQKSFEIEFRLRGKFGKWLWILSRGRIMERDAAGLPVRMLGTHTDISLRKEQEQALLTVRDELEDRVARRTIDLVKVNRSLLSEIRIRRQTERKLVENETYLSNILDGMQTGVIIIDALSHVIVDINQYAAEMIGEEKEKIKGRVCYRFLCPNRKCPMSSPDRKVDSSERILLTAQGRQIPVLKSVARIQREGRDFFVESFIDMRDLKSLIKEQEMDIVTAKNILNLTTGRFHRIIRLSDTFRLRSCAISLPCHQEGGDHCFIHTQRSSDASGADKTFFSLKDQSGHKVGCLLRSIVTDMLHRFLLRTQPQMSMTNMVAALNSQIVRNRYFREKDFVTALIGEIDHQSLMLEYMLCGHSHFFVMRGENLIVLPGEEAKQGKNMPIGALDDIEFSSAFFQLMPGDRIIAHTDGLDDALHPGSQHSAQTELTEIAKEISHKPESVSLCGMIHRLLSRISDITGNRIDPSGINRTADDITIVGLEIEDSREYEEEIWHPGNLRELQHCIDSFFQIHERLWNERGFENPMRLRLALAESAVNAWKHGNQCHPEKKIRILSRYRDDFLLEIHDEGQGFDPSGIPDPSMGNHVYKPHGRGILMIRCHADCFAWNRKGNAISMLFCKNPDSAEKKESELPVL